jgi:hypothetical protein
MSKFFLRAALVSASLIAILGFVFPGNASPKNAVPDDGKALVYAQPPAAASTTGPCDRDCLYAVVDKYFDALASHCAGCVALAPAVKYTENGQLVKPGEGIWKTYARRGTYRVYLADPANGLVGYYGSFSEYQGQLFGVMALRIKVKDRQITEVEMIVNREQLRPKGGLGANTAGIMTPPAINELQADGFISPDSTLLKPLTASERSSREQLIGISNNYFEAFTQSKGSVAPLADQCSRRENGIAATSNPDGPVLDPAQPAFRVFSQNCAQELDRGFFSALTKVRNRRQLVVDEDQGLILDLTLIDNPGNVKSVAVAGVGTVAVPQGLLRPITYLTPQLFKIENGKIRQIEGLAWPVPYGMRSGWDN